MEKMFFVFGENATKCFYHSKHKTETSASLKFEEIFPRAREKYFEAKNKSAKFEIISYL